MKEKARKGGHFHGKNTKALSFFFLLSLSLSLSLGYWAGFLLSVVDVLVSRRTRLAVVPAAGLVPPNTCRMLRLPAHIRGC